MDLHGGGNETGGIIDTPHRRHPHRHQAEDTGLKTVMVAAIFGAPGALILRQQFRRPAREVAAAGQGSG
jgi:hypothetical protein